MIYLWFFLIFCIVLVILYINQIKGSVTAFIMAIFMLLLIFLLYPATMWLTGGNELVTVFFLFLVPACGLMIHLTFNNQ